MEAFVNSLAYLEPEETLDTSITMEQIRSICGGESIQVRRYNHIDVSFSREPESTIPWKYWSTYLFLLRLIPDKKLQETLLEAKKASILSKVPSPSISSKSKKAFISS